MVHATDGNGDGRTAWETRLALTLFFDGGCRPNPGPIEIAVVARGVTYLRVDLGDGSNNDAEWLAALHALAIARSLGAADLRLLGDSALVVGQAQGTTICRPPLHHHLAAYRNLAAAFDRVRIRRVSRFQNLAGTALDRRHSGR